MYKQKNLTDFKLLVERHLKQKWKKFTVSKNWISLKTKMIDFQKKKIRYKDLEYDIYDTATLNLLIQNEIVLIKCFNFVSKVQSKIINQ